MFKIIGRTVITVLFLSAILTSIAEADWIKDGVTVCDTIYQQEEIEIISDGAGGAIIVWEDPRNGVVENIYAQRLDTFGNELWTPGGVHVSPYSARQIKPVLARDGSGGAIIAWEDYRNGNKDIYCQRVSASGNSMWASAGLAVTTVSGTQDCLSIVSNGEGKAFLVWEGYFSTEWNIYFASIDSSGTILHAPSSLGLSGSNQRYPRIALRGNGGSVIVWEDNRNGNDDIYGVEVDESGYAYSPGGIGICTETSIQNAPQIIYDGLGSNIVVWEDERNSNYDIYAQKLSYGGWDYWGTNGKAICTDPEYQNHPRLCSDGYLGAIIAWSDDRSGIYAQRVDFAGNVLWASNGIEISAYGVSPIVVSDRVGGGIILWSDSRSESNSDIYAQRIDGSGTILGPANGVPVCEAYDSQSLEGAVSDGEGGAIATWLDRRYYSTNSYDVYAQRVERNLYWGYPAPEIESVSDVPGDQGGYVYLNWSASRLDPWPEQSIDYYSIWKAVDVMSAATMISSGAVVLNSGEEVPCYDEESTVIREGTAGSTTRYWELVTTMEANFYERYSRKTATDFDSTGTCSLFHHFQICAHSTNPLSSWTSLPDSGYSVDNLSPCQPLGLSGAQSESPTGLKLTWNRNSEQDLDRYAIYRGSTEDFVPGSGNLIASPCDTTHLDQGWSPGSDYYYKVAAFDVHGNESEYALLTPDDVTGDDTPVLPVSTYLAQNFPNPFNPVTTIKFGLKNSGHVALKIYDPAGKLIRTLIDGYGEAKLYEAEWDGKDNRGKEVASGVYFYSLTMEGFKETKKMILMR